MSTPMETNTEELQEILQTVYNLPNAGGGSAEPDLVIGLNFANTKVLKDGSTSAGRMFEHMTLDDVSVEGGSISETVEKIKQGIPVKVALKAVHFYMNNAWFRDIGMATHVALFAEDWDNKIPYPNTRLKELGCLFMLLDFPSNDSSTVRFIQISLDCLTGEPLLYRAQLLETA